MKLFVYGTLMPGQPNYRAIGQYVQNSIEVSAQECGLYDYGPFPVLRREAGFQADGVMLEIMHRHVDTCLGICDQIEGGLYVLRPVDVIEIDEAIVHRDVLTYIASPAWPDAMFDDMPQISKWGTGTPGFLDILANTTNHMNQES